MTYLEIRLWRRSLVKMRSYYSRVGPAQYGRCLYKKRDTQAEDSGVIMEAEIGAAHLQTRTTKDCRRLPKAGKARREFCPVGVEGEV